MPSTSSANLRYSELDWLRVILILAVFLHHVFMPFNGDGWHVVNDESSKVLDDIMVYFEQLRLQTLFFIAGAGSFILLSKTSAASFLSSKFHRLFVPLIIGMMLIVPPQNYYENIGDYAGIVDAYKGLMFSFDANHLWFIEFLIIFMVFAVLIKAFINTNLGTALINQLEKLAAYKYGLFLLAIALVALRCGLKLIYPTQDHSALNLSVSLFFFFFFIAGMIFIASGSIWQAIEKHRRSNLIIFVICSLAFYTYYLIDFSPYASLKVRWQLWWMVCSLVSWSGMLVMLGYAKAYCKKTPKWLFSANELIYPFYILHQTIIVVFAYYIVQWNTGIAVKSISLLLLSFLLCSAICYFLIRQIGILRYLFGLKSRSYTGKTSTLK